MSEAPLDGQDAITKLDNDEDLLNIMKIRHIVYTFLARMFGHELAVSDIKTLSKRAKGLKVLPEVLQAEDDTKLNEALKLLVKTTESFDSRKEEGVALDLAVEYAGLFLGVRRKPPHPSESVYRSGNHLLMQKERDEVMFAYDKAGFEKDESFFKEPEDHIALELAFMSELSGQACDLLLEKNFDEFKDCLNVQKNFLEKHLTRWIEDLVKDIRVSAKIDFYLAIGNITARFVPLDSKLVSDAIGSLPSNNEKNNSGSVAGNPEEIIKRPIVSAI